MLCTHPYKEIKSICNITNGTGEDKQRSSTKQINMNIA